MRVRVAYGLFAGDEAVRIGEINKSQTMEKPTQARQRTTIQPMMVMILFF